MACLEKGLRGKSPYTPNPKRKSLIADVLIAIVEELDPGDVTAKLSRTPIVGTGKASYGRFICIQAI